MATSYLSPGVYIEEVDRGSKPIEAVGTSTCAFIGESSVGPTNEAVLVTNWAQYTRTFGDFQHSTLLAHAVYGFFNNGGTGRRSGLNVFNDIPEISLVCAPGQSDPAIQDAVISHCENNKYRFAILDSAEELGKDGIAKMPKPRDSQYAA